MNQNRHRCFVVVTDVNKGSEERSSTDTPFTFKREHLVSEFRLGGKTKGYVRSSRVTKKKGSFLTISFLLTPSGTEFRVISLFTFLNFFFQLVSNHWRSQFLKTSFLGAFLVFALDSSRVFLVASPF